MNTLMDWLIALEWLGVAGYFVRRFFINRRLISLALAAMALGWALVGLGDRIIAVESGKLLIKAIALGFGVFLWFSIWSVEREKN